MGAQEFPTLNGVAQNWVDVVAAFTIYGGQANLENADISDISWARAIERGAQFGTGGHKRKRTHGRRTFESSLTFYLSGHTALSAALAEVAPEVAGVKEIGDVPFDLIIQHTAIGEVKVHTVEILGCVLNGDSMGLSEGVDPSKVEVPLDVMKILVDGVAL